MKSCPVLLVALALALCASALSGQDFPEDSVAAYMDSVDAALLPVNCRFRMSIVDGYSSGDARSSEGFIIRKNNRVVWVATAPSSQKNFALLRDEDVFYERFATTNKVVKTSATASARGGETSNLDLTRFNTNLDYTVAYRGSEEVSGKDCYLFELKAKNRKLAYSLVRLWVDKATRMHVKKAFYAISGKMLKYYDVTSLELEEGRVKTIGMKYVDALKPEETSDLRIYDITSLAKVPDQFFTKEYLESGRPYPYQF